MSLLIPFRKGLSRDFFVFFISCLVIGGLVYATYVHSEDRTDAAIAERAANISVPDRVVDNVVGRGTSRTLTELAASPSTIDTALAAATSGGGTSAGATRSETVPVNTSPRTGSHSATGTASSYKQTLPTRGCAHETLPFGTPLTITNVGTGASTTCVVNDRGPYIVGRIVGIDEAIFRTIASSSSDDVFSARITW